MLANMTPRQVLASLRLTEAKLRALQCAAATFLTQDARYDDLTEDCAAAKRKLARLTRELRSVPTVEAR